MIGRMTAPGRLSWLEPRLAARRVLSSMNCPYSIQTQCGDLIRKSANV